MELLSNDIMLYADNQTLRAKPKNGL